MATVSVLTPLEKTAVQAGGLACRVYIEGLAELDANLKTLGERVEKKVIHSAVRYAQQAMLAAAQSKARTLPHSEQRLYITGRKGQEDVRMSELIARSLIIKAPRRQQRGSYALHVQLKPEPQFYYTARGAHTKVKFTRAPGGEVNRRIGGTIGVSYIPAAIEFGHGSTPEQAARPYLRPAADESQNEVLRRFMDALRTGLLREAMLARSRTSI